MPEPVYYTTEDLGEQPSPFILSVLPKKIRPDF